VKFEKKVLTCFSYIFCDLDPFPVHKHPFMINVVFRIPKNPTNVSVFVMKCRTPNSPLLRTALYSYYEVSNNSGELKKCDRKCQDNVFDVVSRLAVSCFALPTAPQPPRRPHLIPRSHLIVYVKRHRLRRTLALATIEIFQPNTNIHNHL
jgi:hypothetical protein